MSVKVNIYYHSKKKKKKKINYFSVIYWNKYVHYLYQSYLLIFLKKKKHSNFNLLIINYLVLKKVPIVQHFLFGSLISFNESEEKPVLATMVGAASSIAPTSSSIGSIGMGPGLSSTSTVLPSTSYYTSHRSINQLKNRYS